MVDGHFVITSVAAVPINSFRFSADPFFHYVVCRSICTKNNGKPGSGAVICTKNVTISADRLGFWGFPGRSVSGVVCASQGIMLCADGEALEGALRTVRGGYHVFC